MPQDTGPLDPAVTLLLCIYISRYQSNVHTVCRAQWSGTLDGIAFGRYSEVQNIVKDFKCSSEINRITMSDSKFLHLPQHGCILKLVHSKVCRDSQPDEDLYTNTEPYECIKED